MVASVSEKELDKLPKPATQTRAGSASSRPLRRPSARAKHGYCGHTHTSHTGTRVSHAGYTGTTRTHARAHTRVRPTLASCAVLTHSFILWTYLMFTRQELSLTWRKLSPGRGLLSSKMRPRRRAPGVLGRPEAQTVGSGCTELGAAVPLVPSPRKPEAPSVPGECFTPGQGWSWSAAWVRGRGGELWPLRLWEGPARVPENILRLAATHSRSHTSQNIY